jgi:hypothetical protein
MVVFLWVGEVERRIPRVFFCIYGSESVIVQE